MAKCIGGDFQFAKREHCSEREKHIEIHFPAAVSCQCINLARAAARRTAARSQARHVTHKQRTRNSIISVEGLRLRTLRPYIIIARTNKCYLLRVRIAPLTEAKLSGPHL